MRNRARFYRFIQSMFPAMLSVVALYCLIAPALARLSQTYYSNHLKAEVNTILAEANRGAETEPEDYAKSVALSALAEAQHRAGSAAASQTLKQAREAAARVKDNFAREEAFKTLAQAQYVVDDSVGARRSLQNAILAAEKMPSTAPKDWSSRLDYEARKIGQTQADYGFLTDAQTTADHISDSRTKSILEMIIAERLLAAGKISDAVLTVRDADSHDKAVVLCEVAEAQVKAGKIAEAERTIADATQAANLIDRPAAQANAWDAIAIAQARAGDLTGALTSAAKSRDSNTLPHAQKAVVEAQIAKGDLTGAHQTADNITNNIVKCGALQAVAETQLKSGDAVAAAQTAHEARQIASQVNDLSNRCFALCAIADAQIKSKNFTGARRTLQDATAAANAIADNFGMTFQLSLIAESQIKAGDLDGARKNIDSCASDKYRVQSLEDIAEAQIKAGNKSAARNTLKDASKTIYVIMSNFQVSDIGDLAVYGHTVALQEKAEDLAGALSTLRLLHRTADTTSDVANKSVALSNIVSGLYKSSQCCSG